MDFKLSLNKRSKAETMEYKAALKKQKALEKQEALEEQQLFDELSILEKLEREGKISEIQLLRKKEITENYMGYIMDGDDKVFIIRDDSPDEQDIIYEQIVQNNLRKLCMERFGRSPYSIFYSNDTSNHLDRIPLKKGTLNNIQHGRFPVQQKVKEIIVKCFNDTDKECTAKVKDFKTGEKIVKTFTPPKTTDENGEITKLGINTYWDFVLRVKYGDPSNFPCSPQECVDRFIREFSKYSANDRIIFRNIIHSKLRINSKYFPSEWNDALTKKNTLILACADKIEEVFNWPYNLLLSDDPEDHTYSRLPLRAKDSIERINDSNSELEFIEEGRTVELTMEYNNELTDSIFKHCRNVFLEFSNRNIVIMKAKDSNELRILTDKSAAEAIKRVGDEVVLGDRMLIEDVDPEF